MSVETAGQYHLSVLKRFKCEKQSETVQRGNVESCVLDLAID